MRPIAICPGMPPLRIRQSKSRRTELSRHTSGNKDAAIAAHAIVAALHFAITHDGMISLEFHAS